MTFSDEQSMLLDTATEFFRARSPVAEVRNQLQSELGFAADQWREMVELGWTGLAIPEAYGGSELGLAAAVTIAEPMGRHLSATPLMSTQLFVQGLLSGADEAQKSRWLPLVAAGAAATVALFEEDGNWDLTSAQFDVSKADGQLVLSGVKTFVNDALAADWILLSGRNQGEPCLVLIAREELAASALNRETVIDETRRSYRLAVDGLRVPLDRLIQGEGALLALDAIRNAAWLLIAAESAGGIAGVLDVIVEYLNVRVAFGRKIGSYQGLKHPSADILIGLERSRSHVYHAASLLDAGEDAEVALRMAKVEAAQTYAFAGDRAIQFHGGFGFTYECDAQLFLRRALWSQYAFGDAAHHRKRLAAALL